MSLNMPSYASSNPWLLVRCKVQNVDPPEALVTPQVCWRHFVFLLPLDMYWHIFYVSNSPEFAKNSLHTEWTAGCGGSVGLKSARRRSSRATAIRSDVLGVTCPPDALFRGAANSSLLLERKMFFCENPKSEEPAPFSAPPRQPTGFPPRHRGLHLHSLPLQPRH